MLNPSSGLGLDSPLPWIDLRLTERTGHSLIPPGPHLSAAERDDTVAELRAAAQRTPGIVAESAGFTHLDVSAGGDNRVIDRRGWVSVNTLAVRSMMAAWRAPEQPATLASRVKGRALGVQLGGALSLIGRRVLGQYDPFGPRPGLVLVAPTIVEVERILDVVPSDFRTWVCLHEQTHRLQFSAAPWLATHLLHLVHTAISVDSAQNEGVLDLALRALKPRAEEREFSNGSMLDLFTSPVAAAALDRVTAVMSLLEGHADVMMDRAGPEVIASLAVIRSRFDGRRAEGGLRAVTGKLLGMDAKLAQYRDGARFCRAVIDGVGVAGLNRVWTSPEALPTRAELAEPTRWLNRMA